MSRILPLLVVLILTFGCYARQKPAIITFPTPYGEIEKNSSMREVMVVLGNPHRIVSGSHSEVWHYYLGESQHIIVSFHNGTVSDIKEGSDRGEFE